jgi:hypothetical protein
MRGLLGLHVTVGVLQQPFFTTELSLDDGDGFLSKKVAAVRDSSALTRCTSPPPAPGCRCAGTSRRSFSWTSMPPTSTRVRRPPLLSLPIIMSDLVALNLLGHRSALASYPHREVVSTCFVRFDLVSFTFCGVSRQVRRP